MRKYLIFIFAILATWTPSLGSAGYYSDDYCESCCSDYTLYVDYLYWKVCESDLRIDRNDDFGRYVNPDRHSGWRIGGMYHCGAGDLHIRYTDYQNTTKRSHPTTGETARFKFDWNVLDLELGYTFGQECPFSFRSFGGVKLAWIDESFNDTVIRSDHKYDGYGLYTGGEAAYTFWNGDVCCSDFELSLVVRGSYGILSGTSKSKDDNNINHNGRKECIFVSTIEMFAGIDIGYDCFSCLSPHLLIGYESNTVLGWREQASSDRVASLGLGGLVIRFLADF